MITLLALLTLGVHFHIAFIKRQWNKNPKVISLIGMRLQ